MAKKAVKRSAAKKAVAKKKAGKGPVNRKEVREQIAGLVASNVVDMTMAIIEEANKGTLAQFKYLLEVSDVFPPAAGSDDGNEDSDALARFLLDRLRLPNLPEEDEEEGPAFESKPVEMEEESVSVE